MSEIRPWHREPWPWIVIGLLGAAVTASLVTLWIATTNPDHLVIDKAQYQRVKSEMRAQDPAEQEDQQAPAARDDG